MSKKILIVEDNHNISDLIKLYLSKEKYQCFTNFDGKNILNLINQNRIDMVLLDLMLPHRDGIAIAKEIRKKHTIPIIMITAKQEEMDKIVGLEVGADDYMVKPFSPKEMVARVKALFRRVNNHFKRISKGNIIVEIENKQVFLKDKKIKLSQKEYQLLKLLITHPGRVFSRDYLLDVLYFGDNEEVFDRAIDVCVTRLRKKIADFDKNIIESVHGFGYKFNENL